MTTGPTEPIRVQREEAGQTVAAVLKRRLGWTWSKAKDAIATGQIRIGSQKCIDPARRVRVDEQISIVEPKSKIPAPRPKKRVAEFQATPVPSGIIIRHVDDHILVVDKPPGLTTMRHRAEAAEFGKGKKYLPTTLADLLPPLVGDGLPIIAVHRIDKDTSGLVVFARNPAAKEHLDDLFRRHDIERRYLAIVRGEPKEGRIETMLVDDRGDHRRGSGPGGQRAVTYVRLLRRLGPLSLVECRLETGRTHQVRVHLGESGCPIAGERVYDRPIHGAPLADPSGARRTLLHAAVLGLRHPASGATLRWESPIPEDMARLL